MGHLSLTCLYVMTWQGPGLVASFEQEHAQNVYVQGYPALNNYISAHSSGLGARTGARTQLVRLPKRQLRVRPSRGCIIRLCQCYHSRLD